MCKREVKEQFPELLKEQVCQCCGKIFNYTDKQVKTRIKHLKAGKNIIIACSKVCTLTVLNKSQEHRDKVKQTCLKKYGVDNYSKTDIYKDRYKQTSLKKYGVDNYLKTQVCKDKLLKARKQKRFSKKPIQLNFQGLKDYISKYRKAKLQDLEKYFVIQEVKDILSKYNLTKSELRYRLHKNIPLDKVFTCKQCGKQIKFSDTNGYRKFCCIGCANTYKNKSKDFKDKVKQSYLEKYGVETNLQLEVNKQKSKQTCLKRYGASSYMKSEDYRLQINEIQDKIYTTKKQNNTFSTSEPEEEVYKLLLTKFTKEDIERQYKSKVYPYRCDFYIKSKDLYIEYNGHFTHGLELFNKDNPEHQKILAFWKNKNTKFYNIAIYVWTVLDPLKLKIATENKLNYKIFWNLDEVKKFIGGI